MRQKKSYEEKRERMRRYYHEVVKPKMRADAVYYPEKLKTPRRPIV